MKLRFAGRADKDYADLPVVIRKAFAKQLLPIPKILWDVNRARWLLIMVGGASTASLFDVSVRDIQCTK